MESRERPVPREAKDQKVLPVSMGQRAQTDQKARLDPKDRKGFPAKMDRPVQPARQARPDHKVPRVPASRSWTIRLRVVRLLAMDLEIKW